MNDHGHGSVTTEAPRDDYGSGVFFPAPTLRSDIYLPRGSVYVVVVTVRVELLHQSVSFALRAVVLVLCRVGTPLSSTPGARRSE
eukprot:COSAG06_NODE_5893_length_3186_cov_4.006396_4_plen_85_part_00